MSLLGAMNASVSALAADSNWLGVISNNIGNVNTTGYKENAATFNSLVTSASGAASYSPGGVLSGTAANISQQGILQGTSSPTDIAISGSGFFVVNSQSGITATGTATTATTTSTATTTNTGQVSYTRAGSFTQDSSGNFKNSAGFFLQAWKLDSSGNLPTNNTNLTSLTTVNVSNLTGAPSPSTTVAVVANLNSAQTVYPGASGTITPSTSSLNSAVSATTLLVPQVAAPALAIGDNFKINTSNGTPTTYTYGGFTYGNNITTGLGGLGNSPLVANLAAGAVSVGTNGTTTAVTSITVTSAAHGLATGDVVQLAGLDTVNGVNVNGTWMVTVTGANTYTLNLPTPAPTATAATPAVTNAVAGTASLSPTIGNLLDATTASAPLLGITGTTPFAPAALKFTVTTGGVTSTFTYTSASPNSNLGQFNTLNSLAAAINQTTGLNARIVNNQLYVGATDATQAITFANGQSVGTTGTPPLFGIDWVKELGVTNTTTSANTFSTMQGLANMINSNTAVGATATINNGTSSASLSIATNDPLGTIQFGNTVGGNSDIMNSFGLPTVVNGPAYSSSTNSMASGKVTPAFSRPITVYDAQGAAHQLTVGFVKTSSNIWAAEIYDATAGDSTNSQPIAAGQIVFNADGTLGSISSSLQNISANWSDGATSPIAINWGTQGQLGTGKADGLSQYSSAYNVVSTNQNGAPVGQLSGVSITATGFVVAAYSNGQTQNLYKIPLASFAAPDQLSASSGNVYNQSATSGTVNIFAIGNSNVGTIAPSQLEGSNADLATELTNMIIAQRAYQANTKTLSTVATMLDDLNQAIH